MKKIALLVLTFFIFVGCNTQKVSVDYDRNVDFTQIKSFQLNQNVSTGLSEFDQIRLYEALEKQFKFKGVIKSEKSDVEVKVVPKEYVSNNTASNVGVGIGTGILSRVGGGISVGIPVSSKRLNQEYIVSMYQNSSLIWEGILNLKMPLNASAEAKQASITAGVTKLLQNYPPKIK